ncbi:MAG: FGGY family carbohydrate kinase, partial [Anaerolineaceae bacterium]
MPILLGIDAGTTSVKAGLFNPDGSCLGVARREYQLATPAADRAELDPQIYWQSCIDVVREVLHQTGAAPDQVKALAVSSQGETLIPTDEVGQAIYPAIVWLDNRAIEQAELLKSRFQQDVYARTGIPEVVATWPACKLLWLQQHEPAVFSHAAKYLLLQDYLIYHLTGRFVTDGSISCTTMYYDIRSNTWWAEMLAAIGIRAEQLPEIVSTGSKIGTLSEEAAKMLGLQGDTSVVTGGMDQAVGAIGAGNIKPGIISETTGAALAIQASITNPDLDPRKVVPVYLHSVPAMYLFVPVCPTAGMAFKWLRDTFAQTEMAQAQKDNSDAYELLTVQAAQVPPGSDGLIMLPHLMGAFSPEPNLAARGSFTGFTLRHTRAHFVRALLEGVAFLLKQNLEMIKLTGIKITEIRSTGGGARSSLWNQIKADVCNLPVITMASEETGLLGDAILAGVASGVFSSIQAGCDSMVKLKETCQPGEMVQAYLKPYQSFCELDRVLAEYYRKVYS